MIGVEETSVISSGFAMNNVSFEATVVGGQIRLPADVHLPENSKVFVIVPSDKSVAPARVRSPRLVHPKQAAEFNMEVREIADAGVCSSFSTARSDRTGND